MGRGPKPTKREVKAKPSITRKSRKDDDVGVRDLEELLAEALAQQTATGEILRAISHSPTDYQPVFDAIVRSATEVCAAYDAVLALADGEEFIIRAQHGPIGAPIGVRYPMRGTAGGLAVRERRPVHVENLAEAAEFPAGRDMARRDGHRTTLCVPLLREGLAMGTIMARRAEVRPFTGAQIALLQTFADQAVIAIENVRLFSETKEALERQTATAEILRVISSSPTDVQPVFAAVLASGVRLCRASFGGVFRFDGELVHFVTSHGWPAKHLEAVRRVFPMPPGDGSLVARAIRDGGVVQTPDYVAAVRAGATWPRWTTPGEQSPRSTIAIPMLRDGRPLGGIVLARADPGLFSDQHVALLKTFADQAVIAIENVRLFTELQARNRDLTESLDRQTATAEILRIISRAPTDLQPVFDAILDGVVRLFRPWSANVCRFDGELIHLAATHGGPSEAGRSIRDRFPTRPTAGLTVGRCILSRAVVEIHDVETDAGLVGATREMARARGWRSALAIPMLREGGPVGAIMVTRTEPGSFESGSVELLQTFADQAVIAIENVRLFTELESSNRELTTALDKQTATSEILRAITHAPTDTQPVFDTIVRSAAALCRAATAALFLTDGRTVSVPANYGSSPESLGAVRAQFPRPLDMESTGGMAILTRSIVQVLDTEAPDAAELVRKSGRLVGFRSLVTVPMLRQGEAVGAIGVYRREPGRFSEAELDLLKIFADQAVIAIENVRLVKELQARTQQLTRSVEQLTALREVGHAVSSSLDLETVLNTIVARAVQLAGAHSGTIWEYDAAAEEFVLRITQNVEDPELRANTKARVRRGEGAVGRLAISQRPVQIPDILHEGAYEGRLRDSLVGAGTRALLAIPLLHEDQLLGGLVVSRRTPGEFPAEVVDLLASFATQSALALQNARLFLEIEDKSRQLEAASQHKSEFLANMSHELRTPLNAIIGFSEVLSERMFGELNEKQEEYLKDIYASGQHLLSLINDILDLSKIEAGRMELELTDFHLPTALDNALALVRERAGRRSIALHLSVDERLGHMRADERKVRQVVLNLLSNAVKFTPEGGRIEVAAVAKGGLVEVSVSDTGVGIPPEDQEAVFEEFRQVGTSDKKVEGTGLGLTLCRKFVELHGGRISVKSQVGVGSTFTFSTPVRHGE